MPNMKQKISNRNFKDKKTEEERQPTYGCNCTRAMGPCPLGGKCLAGFHFEEGVRGGQKGAGVEVNQLHLAHLDPPSEQGQAPSIRVPRRTERRTVGDITKGVAREHVGLRAARPSRRATRRPPPSRRPARYNATGPSGRRRGAARRPRPSGPSRRSGAAAGALEWRRHFSPPCILCGGGGTF